MQADLIQQVIRQFTLDFIANPYLCYTEHGLHALFYSMLYQAMPPGARTTHWGDHNVGVIQKEYPTAGNLGKPQRQHWDIAVIKTPPESIIEGMTGSYDYLKLAAVVEFGMNESREHLVDDIERLSHPAANLEYGAVVHLYRLSKPGALVSHRDWSTSSKRILSVEAVAELVEGRSVDLYYGLSDCTGKFKTGAWLVKAGKIEQIAAE
jgi:hypothetical protein